MSGALLELIELTLRYRGGFSVGPVSGALEPGVFLLRGANGSGKTTLLRAICGELKPTGGRCLVRGEDTWRVADARRHVTLAPAHPDQPTFWTVDECWRFHAALRGRPEWPGETLRATLDLPGDLLLAHASAGQRRRAELLAAFAGDPEVLLLDEPLSNQDEVISRVLIDLIDRWRHSRVILLTSHQPVHLAVDASWTLDAGHPLRLTRQPDEP